MLKGLILQWAFWRKQRNVKTVRKTFKELIAIKQTNDLPLTSFQTDKKIETDAEEIANYFNGYFTSIARELVKSKNMHLS